ncbi:hypothetical protein [Pseudobythopirellula maris]|uniref:hypothetical protein n=1 Tax=Pseudobythopirellula maris TaxID=2527991 RepID=UPI0011B48189|nr:hypothetical protein [Pseudobythopirellula maris]
MAEPWSDPCDAPATSWELRPGVAQVELYHHKRVSIRNGNEPGFAELANYACPAGTSCLFTRTVPKAALIDELGVEVDFRSDHPGALLAVEVVLPRVTDPRTGEPARVLVRSEKRYERAGSWATMRFDGLPIAVKRAARGLRLDERFAAIDEREAYVERVAIVCPGDPRGVRLWIDEVRLESVAQVASVSTPQSSEAAADGSDLGAAAEGPALSALEKTTVGPEITIHSGGLRIDEKYFFPRACRWRDEDFGELAKRGFNTVWLDETPDAKTLQQIAAAKLRVLCPPPSAETLETHTSADWAPVVAWVLPGEADRLRLDSALVEIDRVRRLSTGLRRPLLARTTESFGAWSRSVDGLVVAVSGSRRSLLERAVNESRAGTPILAIASASPEPALAEQIQTLLPEWAPPRWTPPHQTTAAAWRAVELGARGLVVWTEEPITAADQFAGRMAKSLEMLNLRLALIEPWLMGSRRHTVDGVAADSPPLAAFQRQGVELVLPPEPGQSVLLRGLSDGARVAGLSPAGLSGRRARRVAGGVSVAAEQGAGGEFLLVSNDPRVTRSLEQYTSRVAPRAAALQRELAMAALEDRDALDPTTRRAVEGLLGKARLALVARDFATAYRSSYEAQRLADVVAEKRLELARPEGLHDSAPLSLVPETLTDHFRLAHLLATLPRGPNRLYGGSFEEIEQTRRLGWRRHKAGAESTAEVDLAADQESPHGQRYLRVVGRTPARAEAIESPPVTVRRGELLEFTGWARTSGAGYLVLSDSLGGETLSLKIEGPDRWTPFRLLRAAPRDGEVVLRIGVEGVVTAGVDGVMVRAIERPGVRAPGVASEPSASTPQR